MRDKKKKKKVGKTCVTGGQLYATTRHKMESALRGRAAAWAGGRGSDLLLSNKEDSLQNGPNPSTWRILKRGRGQGAPDLPLGPGQRDAVGLVCHGTALPQTTPHLIKNVSTPPQHCATSKPREAEKLPTPDPDCS